MRPPPALEKGRSAAVAVLLAIAAATAGFASSASAQQPVTITFTTAEAEAARTTYRIYCQSCHGESLAGGRGPALVGPAFRAGLLGRSVGAFYRSMSMAMPADNAGALAPDDYLNLVALIASANGFAPGDVALPRDLAALDGMAFR